MGKNGTVSLEINGKDVEAPKGVSVLRAAELNGIYIPTLCSHKDLSPFGGCRLCIVEIEGVRGYPLSCYTEVEEGMKVQTATLAIQEIRRELIQLILSEHPSSCLMCGEEEECREFNSTIRKGGVASGCHYCPNDGECELQDVVDRLGVEDIHYPILYKGYEPEREDPFYDRDYNLCILCGRCVRMCQEIRGTAVLAFNWRGPGTTIGPAFGRSHIEAGCEFCGACVSVCPTGALSEKASKWDGKPDGSLRSTCPFCAIGCQLDLWHKDGRFSKATPALDPKVNDGQACLKGRFCLGEVSHHIQRARKPMMEQDGYWKEVEWEEALGKAGERLGGVGLDEFAMVVSPDCTCESLYAAQKFTRTVMGTNAVDSTGHRSLRGGLGLWARLFGRQISIKGIIDSTRIIAVGLDTRFNFSIVGVEIRKALKAGAEVVTIDARESNLARYASTWLQPFPGREGKVLRRIARALKGAVVNPKHAVRGTGLDEEAFLEAVECLRGEGGLTVVLGPSLFRQSSVADLVAALKSLMTLKGTNLIPLYNGTNTRGVLEMGAFPDVLPGGRYRPDRQAREELEGLWKVRIPSDDGITVDQILSGEKRPKVVYLVGESPFFKREGFEFVIYQGMFQPEFPVDIFLPAASYLESGGTLINVEGRVQAAPRLEDLPDSVLFGKARPDWWILSNLARTMGREELDFENERDIQEEISRIVRKYPSPEKGNRGSRTFPGSRKFPPPEAGPGAGARSKSRFHLVLQPGGYTHRGVEITSKVEGLMILNPEEGFHLNPEDAEALGVGEGEMITVKAGQASGFARARLEPELPRGAIFLFVPEATGGIRDRSRLEPLYRLDRNPCPVEVSRDAL